MRVETLRPSVRKIRTYVLIQNCRVFSSFPVSDYSRREADEVSFVPISGIAEWAAGRGTAESIELYTLSITLQMRAGVDLRMIGGAYKRCLDVT